MNPGYRLPRYAEYFLGGLNSEIIISIDAFQEKTNMSIDSRRKGYISTLAYRRNKSIAVPF